MTAEADDGDLDAVDRALRTWRQGDCIVGDAWFVHRFDPANPLTDDARKIAAADNDLAVSSTVGLAVLTQTCDLVKSWHEQPYVEVAPLVDVPDRLLHEVERGHRPRYAFVPAIAGRSLVVDLDRVMTVEKAVVAGWPRTAGCTSDPERRRFAHALARKRERVAFPDDFNTLVGRLRSRIVEKHGRDSPEGEALRMLREIRVSAVPDWDAPRVQVLFLFVRDERQLDSDGVPWEARLEKWLACVPSSSRFEIEALVTTLDRLTAAEYVESDRLDLDHLSQD